MPLCGGIGNSQPATAEVQNVIESVKDQVLSKTNQNLDCYEAVSFATQVVAGTNFFIKVKIGPGKYIHMRVHRPLPPGHEKLELASIQEDKSENDEITYF